MSGVRWARVARAFRRVALPLVSYYAVTLALPLANGATPSGAFMEHALVVLVVPPIAIILGCAVHTIAHALARLWLPKANSIWRSISRRSSPRSTDASASDSPQIVSASP
jgi:hypothetical protein